MIGQVYLIPCVLHDDDEALQAIPAYITDAVKKCDVFFVENEKTARRYLKKLWREMVIDNYAWFAIHKAEEEVRVSFNKCLVEGKNVGIISEAGCPGVADPGQILVHAAQQINAIVHPLVGPSSILLALMASGMNGQCFQFNGYLPIEASERKKTISTLENDSIKRHVTQIFIETPYRNNQMIKDLLQQCRPETLLCIASDITSPSESIVTRSIKEWRKRTVDLHKRPVIFLIQG